MRRISLLLAGFLFLATLAASLPIQKALGGENSTPSFSINVNREIIIQNGGYIVINETFIFTPKDKSAQLPQSYLIGIPRTYYRNLVCLFAHDLYGSLQIESFEEDEIFKWFKVVLRTDGVGRGQLYSFNLTSVFSDLIRRGVKGEFHAVFPLYPALKDDIDLCNVTLILPPNAEVSPEGFPQEIFLNMTSDFRLLNNFTSPLPAYMNISSWVKFSDETFSILKILEMKREISIDGWGRIYGRDFYDIEMVNVSILNIILPPGSTDISVYDIYEKYPSNNVLVEESLGHGVVVRVFVSDKLKRDERAKISVTYLLPYWKYVKSDWQTYNLNVNLARPDEWFIPKIIVSVLLPEGASIINESQFLSINYEKIGFFQEKATLTYYNVTRYRDLGSLSIKYKYTVLWAAFRPTILAMALIGLATIAVIFIKPPTEIRAQVFSIETLKTLVETYGEAERVSSELESLRQRYIEGKIPKRRYQLTKKMLEDQLHQAKKKLMESKAKIEAGGGHYAEMMRQLERANAIIDVSRRNIEEADFRLRRGEISAEEHNRIVREYTQRIERAKAVAEEIILKLKEEIS
ncbi:MAG: hypothetical protein QXZ64_05525 [Candidatus Bathyarchaeia archaeon]